MTLVFPHLPRHGHQGAAGGHDGPEAAGHQFQFHKENGHLHISVEAPTFTSCFYLQRSRMTTSTLLASLNVEFTCFHKQSNISTSSESSHMPWKQCVHEIILDGEDGKDLCA